MSQYEYLTFLFPDEEEHLVPRHLFDESSSLYLEINHNNTVVTRIASQVFADLTHFLKGNTPKKDPHQVKAMIEAAKQLGLSKTANSLAKILYK